MDYILTEMLLDRCQVLIPYVYNKNSNFKNIAVPADIQELT